MNKKDLALMDDVMDTLTTSSAWQQVLATDARLCAADEVIRKHLDWIRKSVSEQYAFDLEDCINTWGDALTDAAILYGLHVADVIRTVPAMPGELSQHILDRITAAREGVEA